MPQRDPQTGKFVSGGSGKVRRVQGRLQSVIPAADLAGGSTTAKVTGEEAEIVDFSTVLESDEMFHLDALTFAATLAMPTTATAESSGRLAYSVDRDSAGGLEFLDDPFYNGQVHSQEGIVDLTSSSGESTETIHVGELRVEASIADTVNALAAGADIDRERQVLYPQAQAFDRDDELYIPHDINVDNVSDHAVAASWILLLEGRVREE